MKFTDASLLSTWIPPKSMLASEARRQRTLFKGIHDRVWGSEELFHDNPHSYNYKGEGEMNDLHQLLVLFFIWRRQKNDSVLER